MFQIQTYLICTRILNFCIIVTYYHNLILLQLSVCVRALTMSWLCKRLYSELLVMSDRQYKCSRNSFTLSCYWNLLGFYKRFKSQISAQFFHPYKYIKLLTTSFGTSSSLSWKLFCGFFYLIKLIQSVYLNLKLRP